MIKHNSMHKSLRYMFAMLVIVFPVISFAFEPVPQTPEQPYQAIEIDELDESQWWLGTLADFPDLYEFTVSEPTEFHVQLSQQQVSDRIPFQVLVVRQNDGNGGVTEVFRQSFPTEDWIDRSFISLGFSRISMPRTSELLDPGTYRVEISSPNNRGSYLLYAGTQSEQTSWLVSINDLVTVHTHFGVSPLRIFLSIYVLIPTLIIVSLGVLFWRRKNEYA